MSIDTLRARIISEMEAIIHTAMGRHYVPPAAQDWNLPPDAEGETYHPAKALAEALANAIMPEIDAAVAGTIPGSGQNGLPLLRFNVPHGDNVVIVQQSTDGGTTWIDTGAQLFAP
jgi:hypothetical protein